MMALLLMVVIVLISGDRALPFAANYLSQEISNLLPQDTDVEIGAIKAGIHDSSLSLTFQSVILKNTTKGELDFKDIIISLDALAAIPYSGHNFLNLEFAQPEAVLYTLKAATDNQPIMAQEVAAYLESHFQHLKKFKFKLRNINLSYDIGSEEQTQISINEISFTPYERGNKIYLSAASNFTLYGKTTSAHLTLSLADDKQNIIANGIVENLTGNIFCLLGLGGDFLRESTIEADLKFNATLPSLKQIGELSFEVSNWQGRIIQNSYFDHNLDLGDVKLSGVCTNNCQTITLNDISINSDEIEVKAKLSFDASNKQRQLSGNFVVDNLLVSNLAKFWPNNFGQRTKDWILSHIKNGLLTNVNVAINLDLNNLQNITTSDDAVVVNGTLTQGSILYMEGVPEVVGINATIKANGDNVEFSVTEGTIINSTIKGAQGQISDLAFAKSQMKLSAHLEGPLDDLVNLAYAHAGLKQNDFTSADGDSATNIQLLMPITTNDIELKDLNINVTSTISNANIRGVLGKYDLDAANFTALYKNHIATINGKALLNGDQPVDLIVQQNFINNSRSINAKTRMSWDNLPKFGLHKPDFINNFADFEIAISQVGGKQQEKINIDLLSSTILISEIGVKKAIGEPGKLAFTMIEDGRTIALQDYNFELANMASQGTAIVNKSTHELVSLESPSTTIDGGAFAVNMKNNGGVKAIDISGDTLNLSSFKNASSSSATASGGAGALRLTTNLKRLIMKGQVAINSPKFAVDCGPQGCNNIVLKGRFDNTQEIDFQLTKDAISAKSGDAGQALMALGITNKIRQGQLLVSGPVNNGIIKAHIKVDNYYLKKTPSVMKLLGLISLTNISFAGIENIISSNGIDFDTLVADATYKSGDITIPSIRLAGPSMTIVARGKADLNRNQIEIMGSILPNSLVNTIIKFVPLVGKVLSNDNDAFLGVNFKITGDVDDPDVSSNPLSIFTPGELRSLIFQ